MAVSFFLEVYGWAGLDLAERQELCVSRRAS